MHPHPSTFTLKELNIIYEIRVLDLDAGKLMQEESAVKAAVRKSKINTGVTMVADNLAITRMGLLADVPAIEIDGKIVMKGKPINQQEVMTLFQALNL